MKYLNKLENKSPGWLVPAHGPVSGIESISDLKEYFAEVATQANKFIKSNIAFDKTKITIPAKYKDYWWAYIFPFNVKHVYDLSKLNKN